MKHSPLPWKLNPETKVRFNPMTGEKYEQVDNWIYPEQGSFVCLVNSSDNTQGNCAKIVKCVNHHDELVNVLSHLLETIAQLDTTNNNHKITEQLGSLETKANDVLRRAKL